MSVTVDANLLLYASDTSSELQDSAQGLLRELARGPELVYVFWPVTMAYLRIATHPGVFRAPLSPPAACANVERLLSRPNVRAPGEGEDFWPIYEAVVDAGVRGNLVSDAHLVALMRQYSVRTIFSRDRDFRRFEGIEARDPFVTEGGIPETSADAIRRGRREAGRE